MSLTVDIFQCGLPVSGSVVCAGSLTWLAGLKWRRVNINVVSYICAFPSTRSQKMYILHLYNDVQHAV